MEERVMAWKNTFKMFYVEKIDIKMTCKLLPEPAKMEKVDYSLSVPLTTTKTPNIIQKSNPPADFEKYTHQLYLGIKMKT